MTVSLAGLGHPAIIAALHLPGGRGHSVAQLEDYVLANGAVFAEAGFPAIMLQDQTREVGSADPQTVAIMASLGTILRKAFPALALGIIVQAHDGVSPIAIARACGASFVRLKIFVAAAMTMEGPRSGIGIEAVNWRDIYAPDVAILADVFDRTSIPIVDIEPAHGALWAQKIGADGLVITGTNFSDSLHRIRNARSAGVKLPVLLGGSVTDVNVAEALNQANGVIVSTSLMQNAGGLGWPSWDRDKCLRFMDAVRASSV